MKRNGTTFKGKKKKIVACLLRVLWPLLKSRALHPPYCLNLAHSEVAIIKTDMPLPKR